MHDTRLFGPLGSCGGLCGRAVYCGYKSGALHIRRPQRLRELQLSFSLQGAEIIDAQDHSALAQ